MHKGLIHVLLLGLVLLTNNKAFAQGCSQIGNNPICADAEPIEIAMVDTPFQSGCFNTIMSYGFLMQTGSNNLQNANIVINRTDCDYLYVDPVTQTASIKNDTIYLTVIQFDPNMDPCDPASYLNQSLCFYTTIDVFNVALNNLPANSSFLVMVGSNHNSTLFGGCEFTIQAAGQALDISLNADPLWILAGETVVLTASGGGLNEDYNWQPTEYVADPTEAITDAFPVETTSFSTTVLIGQCLVNDSITVPVGVPIRFFNALSPNGDGVNDTWEIEGVERFDHCEVNIYDRWGQNVFRSIGYASPWNGTNRGKFLPTGSYYYVIQLNSPVVYIPPFTGYLSILH